MSDSKKINRAYSNDCPKRAEDCRTGELNPGFKKCRVEGHSFSFHYGDRYGCCPHCGAEVLT